VRALLSAKVAYRFCRPFRVAGLFGFKKGGAYKQNAEAALRKGKSEMLILIA